MPKGFKADGTYAGKVIVKGERRSPDTEFKKGQTFLGSKNGMFGVHMFREESSGWKGGRIKDSKGYIRVKDRSHLFCDKQGYVLESRLVVEKQLGRYLKPEERVHHRGEKIDNRPRMLVGFASESAHRRFEKNGVVEVSEIVFDGRKVRK